MGSAVQKSVILLVSKRLLEGSRADKSSTDVQLISSYYSFSRLIMQPITTRITKLLNIKVPIMAAPMYYASTPALAAKVTAAGGYGMLAAGFDTTKQLKQYIGEIRSMLNVPTSEPVPLAVGFLGWILDVTEESDDPRLPSYLEERPTGIWFAFGTNLGKYVAQVRDYDAKREHKTVIFVIVNSLEEALTAANMWKVDVIVVQGCEAGGHGSSESPTLLEFLATVLKAIPDGPPLIAAGGITTGAQVAGLLAMGASGVAIGTRFLFTHECMYPDEMKEILVAAGSNSTARSYAYDEIHPTPFEATWPAPIDGRALANGILADARQGLSLEERRERVKAAKARGDKNYLLVWAGVGAALVDEIKSTTEVMETLHRDTVSALKLGSSLLAA